MLISNFISGVIESFYYSLIYDNRYKFIIEGCFNTLIIALFSVIIGIIIGVCVALIRNNYEHNKKMKILNFIAKTYVDIVRGTPVILQLMIIYYVIFKSVDISVVLVGILAFGINSGAYVSEIIRAGIQSINIGQTEAGYALGFGKEVIQVCNKSKFSEDGHFDVKQINTVMWDNQEDLFSRLNARIKATIG